MRNKLSIITPHCVISLSSCKKIESLKKKAPSSSEGTLAIPVGFTWQNSRNISLTVNVTDSRYGSSMHMISIYDGDPAAGGKLISKGSATNKLAFESKVYLSKQISSVYIVKTAPDNSTSVSKFNAVGTTITTSISK